MTSLAALLPGAEFDFVVRADLKDELFQASTRVLYDSSVLAAVSVERGEALPANCLFISKLDAERGSLAVPEKEAADGLDRVIPAAFTGRPGDPALRPGKHELLRLRFRLLEPIGRRAAPVRLQNDRDFLQLRDSAGRRIPFDFESRVGVN
jgi:hypothetical protein